MAAVAATQASRRDAGSFERRRPSSAAPVANPPVAAPPVAAPPSQQPSSPTLTNPDMILPDYDDADALDDFYRPPPSGQWTMASAAHADVSLLTPAAAHAMPPGPSTPIIYGNGTMLSDIGEVTEVESVAGSPPRHPSSRRSAAAADGSPLRSSPVLGRGGLWKRRPAAHDVRRLSVDSTGTVHEPKRLAASVVDVFDDCISIGDSSFQGDDEESQASSYVEDLCARPANADGRQPGRPANEYRYSAISLSKRAEQILANAKRRLTTMEGNLSRARTFGYSTASDGSTPSPGPRPAAAPPDEDALPTPTNHSRNASDVTCQGPAIPTARTQRSASALGAAGGYRQPLSTSTSVDALDGRHRPSNMLTYHPLDTTLALLNGDGRVNGGQPEPSRASSVASPTPSSYSDAEVTRCASAAQVRDLQDQMQGLKGKISSLRDQARADSLKRRSLQGLRTPSPFTHARWDRACVEPLDGAPPSDPTSPSCVSPRGGTVLRMDAVGGSGAPAAEGHGRRVLPGLDGPLDGPLDAGTFDDACETPNGHGSGGGVGAVEVVDSVKAVEAVDSVKAVEVVDSVKAVEVVDSVRAVEGPDTSDEDEDLGGTHRAANVAQAADDDEQGGNDNDDDDDDDDADERDNADVHSESGDSTYHDSLPHPISHEDREDAFDYERFFLHSAMGTISRQGLSRRGSSGSEDSADSVETTRGPDLSRARRPSLDTITTVDSFATAVEGRASGRSSRYSMAGDGRAEEGFVTPSQGYEDGFVTPSQGYDDGFVTPSQGYDDGFVTPSQGYDDDDDDDDDNEAVDGTAFGSVAKAGSSSSSDGSGRHWQGEQGRRRAGTVVHRPTNTGTAQTLHRPSISSFESTGTNRSFPLVNRVRVSGGMLTPVGSPEQELKQVADSLMSETVSICDKESIHGGAQSPAMQILSRPDQMMVERVVASLGRCVLGLTEASRSGPAGGEEFRRRIDAARRVLEAGTWTLTTTP